LNAVFNKSYFKKCSGKESAMKKFIQLSAIFFGLIVSQNAYSQQTTDGACCVPSDQPCDENYQLMCRQEPCYYNDWKCMEEKIPCKKQCVRSVPQYYEVEKCRMVPEKYNVTACRYVPQYYQVEKCRMVPEKYKESACRYVKECYEVDDCKTCKKWVCEQKCKLVPKYYWKHNCAPKADACAPVCR